MIQTYNEPVSVILISDANTRAVRPSSVIWAGRTYPIIKVGLHHKLYKGETLVHIYSVVSNNIFFRLELNTDSLLWRLTEVSDGEV